MKKYVKSLLLLSAVAGTQTVMAQAKPAMESSAKEPLAIVMISIAVLLIAVIGLLGKIVIAAYELHRDKEKRKRKVQPVVTLLAGMLLLSSGAWAQETEAVQAAGSSLIGGLSQSTFYFLMGVIVLELIIIAFLVRTFYLFTRLQRAMKPLTAEEIAAKKKKKWAWFEKLNNTKSLDAKSEAEVNLGHDYDGIGELDNPTPPWWQWGFVLSVIFSVVYMYVYHVSKSAPLQIEELAIANEKAEKQIASYLANTANLVDENTVTYLDDASDLAAGQTIFTAVCAACHGVDGGGTVGPNLTDDYWLHGGSIKDIFRTIKYGVPEKGMKSWKDDYSPKQIAQIASYVHSIHGTKPADPKAPEGEKYTEEQAD